MSGQLKQMIGVGWLGPPIWHGVAAVFIEAWPKGHAKKNIFWWFKLNDWMFIFPGMFQTLRWQETTNLGFRPRKVVILSSVCSVSPAKPQQAVSHVLCRNNTATSRNSFYWIAYFLIKFYRLKSMNDWPSAEMIVLYLCPPKAPWPIFSFSIWGWLQSISLWEVTGRLHLRWQLPLRGAFMWVSLDEGSLHLAVCCSTICWGLM